MLIMLLTENELVTRECRTETLLLRLSEGDGGAMEELYKAVSRDIYAFALARIRNSNDAEDVMEDTFVLIYRYAKQYTPKGKPMAWILTIAKNLMNRRRALDTRHTEFDEALYSEDESAEEGLAVSDFLDRLMKHLGEVERETVMLHVVSGLKHREIAKLLDLPLSTVLSRYQRAIGKLRHFAQMEES